MGCGQPRTGTLLGNAHPPGDLLCSGRCSRVRECPPRAWGAPGVSPQPPREGACSQGVPLEGGPCGRAALRPGRSAERDRDPHLGFGPRPATELGPGRTRAGRRAPSSGGAQGRLPARTGASGEGHWLADRHTSALGPWRGRTHGAGGGLWGPGGARGLAARAAAPAAERCLRRAVCHHQAVTLAGKRVNGGLHHSPRGPSPSPPPPYWWHRSACWRPRLRHCCPHRRLPPPGWALGAGAGCWGSPLGTVGPQPVRRGRVPALWLGAELCPIAQGARGAATAGRCCQGGTQGGGGRLGARGG